MIVGRFDHRGRQRREGTLIDHLSEVLVIPILCCARMVVFLRFNRDLSVSMRVFSVVRSILLLQLANEGRVTFGSINLSIEVLIFLGCTQHHAAIIACSIQVLASLKVKLS